MLSFVASFKNWLSSKHYSDSTVRNYLADVNKYLSSVIANQESSLPGENPSLRGVFDEAISLSNPDRHGLRPRDDAFIFSETSISAYLNQLSDSPAGVGKTFASRSLASLTKFCQFALDQHIITTNPIKNLIQSRGVINHAPTKTFDEILIDFKSFLTKHHKSESTITNYISDCQQFISYCQMQNPLVQESSLRGVPATKQSLLNSDRHGLRPRDDASHET